MMGVSLMGGVGFGRFVALLACVAGLAWGGVLPREAVAATAPAGVQSQEEPSQTPSRTRPYYACPRSKPRPNEITCDGVIVPRAYRRAQRLRFASGVGSTQGGFQPDGGHGQGATGFDPADLQRAYDLPSATAGSGQTVGVVIVGDNPDDESDLATYRATYGLPPCTTANGCFKKVNRFGEQRNYPPPAGGNWAVEGASDIEMVSAICPNCHIILVEAPGPEEDSTLATAENTAVALGANEITNSWGHALKAEDLGYEGAFNHPGVLITVAGGDHGYTSQEWPAESPHVMAVGGTSLFEAPNARGFEEFAWSLGGSTCAQNELKPSWQTDTGCAYRTTSDISAVADWKNSPVSIYDVYEPNAFGEIGWESWGGTSASSPIIAATYALTNAYTRSLGPQAIWQYAKEGGSLNDIISGKNSESGCAVTYLCWAGPGYDGPTGWGTPWGAPIVKPPAVGVSLAASGVGQFSAVLNGSVDPEGLDTHFYFQYGESTGYGLVTSEGDAGAGTSAVPESATVSGLVPGVTYHFRIVVSSSAGVSYGGDRTFTTSASNRAVASLRDEKTGRRWVFYRGSEGGLWEWSQPSSNPSSWVHIALRGAHEVAAGSGLSVMHEREAIFVTFTNAAGNLEQVVSNNNGVSWSLSSSFGSSVSPGSTIANVREPSNGGAHSENMWVYYVSANKLFQWRFEGGKWVNSQVTNEVSGTSGLAVMHEREGIFVTYTNAAGNLEQVVSSNDGVSWSLSANFGVGVSPGSTIASVREPSGGSHSEEMWVYYVSSSGALGEYRFEHGEWVSSQATTGVAPGSGLSVMHEREAIFVTYTNTAGNLEQVISNNDGVSWSLSANFGVGVAAGSAIVNLREPSEAGNPNSEDMWVFYYGPNGAVWQEKWAGGAWVGSELREVEAAAASKGDIAWARDEGTGKQWGYYVGTGGVLWQWRYTGGGWVNSQVTNGVSPSSGVAVMRERETIFVTYVNASGNLQQVVSSNNGVSWALSANFGTSTAAGSTIANVREPSNGGPHTENMWVYYVSPSGVLGQWRFEGGKWINSSVTSGVAPSSGVSVMHEREAIFVTYTNTAGNLEQLISGNDGATWALSANFGTAATPGSAIANVREPGNGGPHTEDMWVYYVSANKLFQWRFEGGRWINSQVTNEVAATSGLSVMHEREGIFVTYTNTAGTLEQVISNNDGATWALSANFGAGVSSGSGVANVREPSSEGDPNSENMWVYYVASNGAIGQFKWNGSTWISQSLNTSFEAREETSTVKTESASNITATTATLEGSLSPGGEITHYQFEYGTTTAYGNSIPVSPKEVAEGLHTLKVTQAITGLKANTTYHYRLVTTAGFKTLNGEDKTLTTKAS
jgi:hypothetical protein